MLFLNGAKPVRAPEWTRFIAGRFDLCELQVAGIGLDPYQSLLHDRVERAIWNSLIFFKGVLVDGDSPPITASVFTLGSDTTKGLSVLRANLSDPAV